MTQTQHPRRYALSLLAALVVISALGALAAVALTVQLGRAATPADIPMHRIDAIPAAQAVRTDTPIPGTGLVPAPVDEIVAAVLGGGETYTTTQAMQVHLAADRVCEGMTAGVPLVVIEPELVQEFGLDGATAHQFVITAHALQCPAA